MTPSRYGFECVRMIRLKLVRLPPISPLSHCGFAFYFAHPARFTRVIRGLSPVLLARNRAIRAKLARSKKHVMRPAEFQLSKIQSKLRLQFLAVPRISTNKLLVIGAFLVPFLQERAGKIKSFSVPALATPCSPVCQSVSRNLFRLVRIRNIEHAALAVTKTINNNVLSSALRLISTGSTPPFTLPTGCNFLGLPIALVVRVNEPELRCQRCCGKCVIVFVAPGPADLQWRAGH